MLFLSMKAAGDVESLLMLYKGPMLAELFSCHFYSTSAFIAHNADRCNSHGRSVSLSVCLSVTLWCFIQTNEDATVRS